MFEQHFGAGFDPAAGVDALQLRQQRPGEEIVGILPRQPQQRREFAVAGQARGEQPAGGMLAPADAAAQLGRQEVLLHQRQRQDVHQRGADEFPIDHAAGEQAAAALGDKALDHPQLVIVEKRFFDVAEDDGFVLVERVLAPGKALGKFGWGFDSLAVELAGAGLQVGGEPQRIVIRQRAADELVLVAGVAFDIENVERRLVGIVHQKAVAVIAGDDFPGLDLGPQLVDDALGALRADFEAEALGNPGIAEGDDFAGDGVAAVAHRKLDLLAGESLVAQGGGDGEHRAFEHRARRADIDNADIERDFLPPHAHGEHGYLAVAQFPGGGERVGVAVVGAVADENHAAKRQSIELIGNRFERLADGGAGARLAEGAVPAHPAGVLVEGESPQLKSFRKLLHDRAGEKRSRGGLAAAAAIDIGDFHALGMIEQNGEISVLRRDLPGVDHRAQQAEQNQDQHRRAQADEPGLPRRRKRPGGAAVAGPDRGDDQQREQAEQPWAEAVGEAQIALLER